MGLRSKQEQARYDEYKRKGEFSSGCTLCSIADQIREFKFWKVAQPLFIFDKVAKVHHMIYPKRHTTEEGLNEDEKVELLKIKQEFIEPEYDVIIEATKKKKSIPDHFHIHLVVFKEEN